MKVNKRQEKTNLETTFKGLIRQTEDLQLLCKNTPKKL